MGTGHSADTPLRVAPWGIDSVVSLVDDILLEQIRVHYCKELGYDYETVSRREENGRAQRITDYFDFLHDEVQKRFEAIQSCEFTGSSDKDKYFRMLAENCELKLKYTELLSLEDGSEKTELAKWLTSEMKPGSIDGNIMVKLDAMNYDRKGQKLEDKYSDAKAALRGFANSKANGAMVYSAGINQSLYAYMAGFKDFYRDINGDLRKRIVIKVSDFRSALIQGKFLARKGLEVWEFRVESGLNCGGHAFASQGQLLPILMDEFRDNREKLQSNTAPLVAKYYKKVGLKAPEELLTHQARLSVQGGIGNFGENQRLWNVTKVDSVGWASPFLLVPEATPIDEPTRELLRKGKTDDFYLSDSSPLGVPFNNLHNSGSDVWTKEQAAKGRPGSGCPKGYLVSDTEFTEKAICTASKQYQKQKLAQIGKVSTESTPDVENILVKQCICDHLGNGALIDLGARKLSRAPQSICPGPNLAWFNEFYTLEQMLDHLYGRSESLVPSQRPHMYAAEIGMYVKYYFKEINRSELGPIYWDVFLNNLHDGINRLESFCHEKPILDENFASILLAVKQAREELPKIEITQ
jgi:hypothetical protein